MDSAAIQAALREHEIDGWLLYDFRGSNPVARSVIGFDPRQIATRRWFYLIPVKGEPVAVCHAIEPAALAHAPGKTVLYRSWRELEQTLRELLGGLRRVAMEYSPAAAIPYVARVDAGTVELVRSLGPEVVTSADLVQLFESRWTPEQRALHARAAQGCTQAKNEAFDRIRRSLAENRPLKESEVQAFIGRRFEELGLWADHPVIVAVNEHASDPHFETHAGPDDRTIKKGDLVLIDYWAKVKDDPRAVYYDATWMGYCGPEVPDRITEVWDAVSGARDAAVAFVTDAASARRKVRGAEVDDIARGFIEKRGFGKYFLHRTGHSIGYEVHGNGVNIDNLETRDERTLLPGVCFSIEPGIYLPEFGVRSEIDMYVGEGFAEITGDIQRDILRLA